VIRLPPGSRRGRAPAPGRRPERAGQNGNTLRAGDCIY
jgi:hypothetical protein